MKTEKKLKLSIDSLVNFGVYPEIIKDILNDLQLLVNEKKSEKIAKEHFRKNEVAALLEISQMYNEEELERAYKSGERKQTFYKKNESVILPSNYEGVDG
jgi:alanyl-tRNA synthetase